MEHLLRVQKAIDYIEENLREELPTERIAKVAGFSMWHFQRVFTASLGTPLKEYVRSRRLTSAHRDLWTTEKRILDLALDYQFESQESFTRAFKAQFGVTPGACRQAGGLPVGSQSKPKVTMAYLDHLYRSTGGKMQLNPKFVEMPAIKVVGMEAKFICILSPDRTNDKVIPALWQRYVPRAAEIRNRKSHADIGFSEPLPEGARRSHPDEFNYVAGTEVSDFGPIPEGMIARTVPAGRYAVFTHKGKLDGLEHTMNSIFGYWVPKSGVSLREAPELEIYDDRFVMNSDDSEFDIYIPIV